MKIKLKRKWFSPRHERLVPDVWHTVPDEWEKKVPTGTEVDKSAPTKPATSPYTSKSKS